MNLATAVLEAPLAAEFEGMTFPAYRHLLALAPAPTLLQEATARRVEPLAIGGFSGGVPIALALAGLPLEGEDGPELLSLYVAPPWRGRGAGRGVLAALEAAVAGRGFASLGTVFTASAPGSPAFARLLAARGWTTPQLRTLLMRFTLEQAQQFPWFNRYPLRDGCEIFPWRELTGAERQQLIDSQRQRGWIAADLVPWRWDEHGFEPLTSVGMRSPEGVVGWVINHAISDRTLRFTCSYIRKDYGRRGRILPLYSESINRMRGTQFALCSFVAPMHHATMAAFVRRWMAPWAGTLQETLGSTKAFATQPAATSPRPEDGQLGGRSAGASQQEDQRK